MSVRIDLMLLKTNCRSIGLPRGRFNEPHTAKDVCAPPSSRREKEKLVILRDPFLTSDVSSGRHNNSTNFEMYIKTYGFTRVFLNYHRITMLLVICFFANSIS